MKKKIMQPVRQIVNADRPGIAPLWTLQDVCTYLKMTPGTIRSFVFRRVIPHVKLGRHVRFRKSDIERWYEEHQRNCH